MRVGAVSDVGKVRDRNEDAYWCEPPWFAVADGMGGHAAGDRASELAIEAVRQVASSTTTPLGAVRQALERANAAVWAESRSIPGRQGMGTTLTVGRLDGQQMVIGHVGDSRAYRYRAQGGLELLTSDHSIAGELVRAGALSVEQGLVHPQRHVLTRALGTAPAVTADIFVAPFEPGEGMLFCTDGLVNALPEEEIAAIWTDLRESPQQAVQSMVERANERGGPDNITAVLVDFGPE